SAKDYKAHPAHKARGAMQSLEDAIVVQAIKKTSRGGNRHGKSLPTKDNDAGRCHCHSCRDSQCTTAKLLHVTSLPIVFRVQGCLLHLQTSRLQKRSACPSRQACLQSLPVL